MRSLMASSSGVVRAARRSTSTCTGVAVSAVQASQATRTPRLYPKSPLRMPWMCNLSKLMASSEDVLQE